MEAEIKCFSRNKIQIVIAFKAREEEFSHEANSSLIGHALFFIFMTYIIRLHTTSQIPGKTNFVSRPFTHKTARFCFAKLMKI